jgi:glycolate oxidase iron-sulfur subunit
MDVNAEQETKDTLIKEIAKCRACRFCVDVCPTYQASIGMETLSAYGRLQTLRYLLRGTLDFDDSMSYALYTCVQCRRCEVICKSKGQNLEICKILELGRSLLSKSLAEGKDDERI